MSLDLKSKDINLIKNIFNTFIDKIEIDNDSIYVAINLYFLDMDEGGGSGYYHTSTSFAISPRENIFNLGSD